MRYSFLLAVLSCCTVGFTFEQASAEKFTLEKNDRGVTVKLDGELFTEYLLPNPEAKRLVKPILWPIIGPTGKPITRAYPMENGEGERFDHPHHRSLWFTHGEVNGVDFWAEGEKRGQIQHREFVEVEGGDEGRIVSVNDWIDGEGKKVLEDRRTITFQADKESRWIDFDITLKAGDEKVVFGDTKEGSFGVRVAGSMKVDARQGGKIINSNGQTNGGAWGKRAPWVDYHGPLDNDVVGIAIMNHPSSFRYPTHWHVRTYGLFAANPFGVHDFERKGDGSHTLEPGESIRLRYRVLLHTGDEKQGHVAEAFEAYSKQE
jgi:hypothetical protein